MDWAILSAVALSAGADVALLVLLKQMLQRHRDQVMGELESDPEISLRRENAILRRMLKRILESLPHDHPARNLVKRGGE